MPRCPCRRASRTPRCRRRTCSTPPEAAPGSSTAAPGSSAGSGSPWTTPCGTDRSFPCRTGGPRPPPSQVATEHVLDPEVGTQLVADGLDPRVVARARVEPELDRLCPVEPGLVQECVRPVDVQDAVPAGPVTVPVHDGWHDGVRRLPRSVEDLLGDRLPVDRH